MTSEDTTIHGPLKGVRVLDLTRVLSGPFATMILGDMGAEVVKIEEPGPGDHVRSLAPYYDGGESHYFVAINRNKQSVVIDLKAPEGRDLVLQLAEKSDVVIENFRPDVMDRLGLGYETLKERRPDVILCSISGFGRNGPLRDKPSFDLVTQARSGVMSITGEPDGPPTKLGIPMGDLGGGMWAAIAVLAALQHRNRTGEGQHVDVSLLDCLMGLLGYLGQLSMITGESPGRVGSGHHSIAPYGRFDVKDGHIVLALHVGPFWRCFCHAVGRADLIEDKRFRTTADRRQNREELQGIVEDILRQKTREEWQKILDEADIPHGPILNVLEALNQDQAQERELLVEMEHPSAGKLSVVAPPLRFQSGTERPALRPSPLLGEHTRTVLKELLGLPADDIDGLAERGVVQ